MLARTPSRWNSFMAVVDPFTGDPSNPLKLWAVVGMIAGVVALGALTVYMLMTGIGLHKWMLLVHLLKPLKWFGLGIAFVIAYFARGCFTPKPKAVQNEGGEKANAQS